MAGDRYIEHNNIEEPAMIQLGEAIYEHGTLRLLKPADLREQQHVLVAIQDVAAEEEDDRRPWRGVFAPVGLLPGTVAVELAAQELPRWQPHLVPDPRWTADADE